MATLGGGANPGQGPVGLRDDDTFFGALSRRGMDRRTFLKFCSATAAMLGLGATGMARVVCALDRSPKLPVVWLEFQDCAGNTESFLRSARPGVDELILDALSLDYHETLMAAAGRRAEDLLARTIAAHRGGYVAVVEGSIPTAEGGIYCTIGGRTALDIAREVVGGALATIAAGTCACYGGLPAAAPNPTGAVGVSEAVPGATVINLPACPMNPANVTATIVHYLTFGRWPAVDSLGRPLFAYGSRIHDACDRRAHFEAGEFAGSFGDEGHRRGHCLYKLGCKGPVTSQNCPTVRWNDGMNWPVGAGHPCLGCAEPRFWDVMTPFYRHLPDVPGLRVDPDKLGVALVAGTAGVFTAHGIAHAVARRRAMRAAPGAADPPSSGGGGPEAASRKEA